MAEAFVPEQSIIAAIDAQLGYTPEGSAPAVEGAEAPPTEETPAEAPAAEPEAPAEADAPASEEESTEEKPVAEIPLDQLEAVQLEVTVKGEDGKDVVEKPTIKELREGYMRQKDYSRKTAEVARQREEVGEKVRQAVESQQAQFAAELQKVQALLIETAASELKDVNWKNLAANDPAEYVRLRNRADEITNALRNVDTKQQELKQKAEAESRQAMQKAAQEARERLEAEIPGWNDALYNDLMQVGVSLG